MEIDGVEYLSTTEASKRLQLSETVVRGLCEARVLRGSCQTSANGPWLIPSNAVVEYSQLYGSSGDLLSRFRAKWLSVRRKRLVMVAVAIVVLIIARIVPTVADVTSLLNSFGIRFLPPSAYITPMTGDFNIVVVTFDVEGRSDYSTEAERLGRRVANSISRQIADLEQQLDQEVEVQWLDNPSLIESGTSEVRASNARAVAKKTQADLIVYGTIKVHDRSAEVIPEFSVTTDSASSDAELSEILGQYQMGSVIAVDKIDNSARGREVASILAKRASALTLIANGLAEYVVGAYEEAERYFDKGLGISEWDSPDVIYVMLGNTALRQLHLENAERFYLLALNHNQLYARAYVGLGSVYYERALGNRTSFTGIDTLLLDNAIEKYRRAQGNDVEQPPFAHVSAKARFGEGECFVAKMLATSGRYPDEFLEYWKQAMMAFQSVVTEPVDEKDDVVVDIVAHAHARIGLLRRFDNDPGNAVREYEVALQLLAPFERNREYRAEYEAALGDIYSELANVTKAIYYYELAINHSLTGSARQASFVEKLKQLSQSDK